MPSRPQELPQSPRTQQPDVDFYCVKWIPWKGERTPIITQSTNGPCPLLAIMNILFLQWKVSAEDTASKPRGHRAITIASGAGWWGQRQEDL